MEASAGFSVKTENQETNDKKSGIQHSSMVSGNRRKLIRGGAIGIPVVLALKSTPVLACNCKLPSGFSVSGNLSQTHNNKCGDPALKPSQISSSNPLRQKKFAGNISNGHAGLILPLNKPADWKLGDALSGGGDPALIAAAYINAANGSFSPGATTTMVRNMWNQTANGGAYAPIAGVAWTRTDVISYLNYVMAI